MMKNIIKKYMIGIVALGVISIMAPFAAAHAAGTIDPNPSSWGTGITSVSIAPTNTIGVSKTANAQPGDVVAVNIYYHNDGTSPINNFTIRMTDPSNQGASTNFSIQGTLSGDGTSPVSDSATVNISQSEALTFIPGSVRWFPNQSGQTDTAGQTISASQEDALVGGSGFNIGTLTPGWSSQGGIVAQFQVGSNGGNGTGIAPNVSTSNYSGWNSNSGNVTLNGTFSSNGYDTTTGFQYQLNGGSWITVGTTDRGTGSGPFYYSLTNLPSGTYNYEATASNAYGSVQGSIFTFTISGNTTSCPSNYYWDGNECVQNVTNCPSGYYLSGNSCIQNQTYCPAGYYLSGNTCIQNQTYCPSGYYMSGNSCIQNVTNCPSGYYMSGNTCIQNQNFQTTTLPTVSTLGTISVGGTVAAVDGYYTSTSCAVYTSFKYGTTQSLGNTTGEVNRGTGSGSMAQSLSGLQPGTTYYYQASARNCAGTSVGSIRSFTTTADTTNDTVIYRTITNNIGGSGGNSFINLTIDNHRDTVIGNESVTYDVTWTNLTSSQLKNLVLEVNFPTQMSILNTDQGTIERNKNSVVDQIDTLDAKATGTMEITTQVTGNLKDGDPVVAQAIMAFNNPKNNATENAIAYDADHYSTGNGNSILGASLFGLNFLPTSLAGWLLIILILLLIIILAHSYITRHRTTTMVVQNGNGTVPQNIPMEHAAGATGNDYVVYRPTPKQ